MIEAIRRFLLRKRIIRWKIMHADYLRLIRNEKLFRETDWPQYRTVPSEKQLKQERRLLTESDLARIYVP